MKRFILYTKYWEITLLIQINPADSNFQVHFSTSINYSSTKRKQAE